MTDQTIADLKRERGTIKGSCTRIRTYADAIVAVNPSVLAHLEERRAKLERYWSEYGEVQARLESLEPAEAADRVGFEEAFYALSVKIRELTSSVSASPPPIFSSSNSSIHGPDTAHVRLPKLNLPTFSGKYDEWLPFFDTFNAVIHSNTSLGNSQRFQYLRASLTGDASAIIGSLEISDANYEVAWTLLKKRYDHKRVIVQNHIKSIMELPSMTKENAFELRQISDGSMKHLHALQALKRPTAQWDDLLISILSSKIDSITLREWETSLSSDELPTLKQFLDFLGHRCQVLEATGKCNVAGSKKGDSKPPSIAKRHQAACTATVKVKCHFCQGEHAIYYCKDFLALPVAQRMSEVRARKLCMNCLRSTSHVANKCTSGHCKICRAKHNTLLHASLSTDSTTSTADGDSSSKGNNASSVVVTHASGRVGRDQILLSTAVVHAYDSKGSRKPCRVLLDCGSQASFISREFVTALGLKTRSLNVSISGVSGTTAVSNQAAQLRLQSRVNSYSAVVECIVVDQVTDKAPSFSLKRSSFQFPRNIQLADPQFHLSAHVDVLIGAELFWDLLCVGQINASDKHPTLQKTRLGWIVAGPLGNPSSSPSKTCSFHATITNAQLHDQVSRFWLQEEISTQPNNYTLEEKFCEQHFLDNVSQDSQGRYTVKFPIREQVLNELGDSRETALKRLKGIERRFKSNPELKISYAKFLEEYLSLGHMRQIDPSLNDDSISYYLPHHCVFKTTGGVPKIRVVFDASCRTSTGVSLNDALVVGPVVQPELISTLIRFRFFIHVITADIIKMYRQIRVHPSQTSPQRILWREDASSEVNTYELTTVTYGTASASYLATRCLKHLGEQHESQYPRGSACINRDLYVDDLLTGADTIEQLKTIRDETIQLLRLGSFELSKWSSNCPELLEMGDRNLESVLIKDNASDSHILGMQWNQHEDIFQFSYQLESSVVSKRSILSEVAKLFDPLGLLGPIIVVVKLILQELWQLSIQWDESVPQGIHMRWTQLKAQLTALSQLQIPRCVKPTTEPQAVQVHGFCDASQRAYGACIYIRVRLNSNDYQCSLLCSKSRVAPLRAVSLPRLELSSALLLARLIDKVTQALELTRAQIYLWSDSTIALNWIASPSRRWSVFVANRVGEIQRLTDIESWRHVASADNPADMLSRGLEPRQLVDAGMWWNGPAFLKSDDHRWPSGEFACPQGDLPEQRRIVVGACTSNHCIISELLVKYSSLSKVCRIVSYCLRFTKLHRSYATSDFVSPDELTVAMNCISRAVQKQAFSNEYRALAEGNTVCTSSSILSLSPFLDEHGLIRVGGRLGNSNLAFEFCHPILLPRKHVLVQRIVESEHVRNLHAGLQATMAFVRQRFWPISLRSTARKIVQGCVTCFKAKPKLSEVTMGSLPASRVHVSRPFSQCGVDYAGPIMLREGKRRNARNHKAYIALFVCFATKAVHLELVSDLTAEAFIAAFKRFISRRGKPAQMFSDNGTTFVGAQKLIKELYDALNDQQTQASVRQFLCDSAIAWNFIPPNAPHFGGLWEAAVKSAKHHMTRIIGKAHLTFEEMQTVLCEIEAVLNSRPLTPLSTDPNDLAYLSPGHFLVGTTLNSFPCTDLTDVNENRLVRWQRVEQLRQHFWRRWSGEYLHLLLERTKWRVNKGEQLAPNQIVLIKQQNLPPLQWTLGRVQEIFPGSDGLSRVAAVKTAKGSYVRPLTKLAILPTES